MRTSGFSDPVGGRVRLLMQRNGGRARATDQDGRRNGECDRTESGTQRDRTRRSWVHSRIICRRSLSTTQYASVGERRIEAQAMCTASLQAGSLLAIVGAFGGHLGPVCIVVHSCRRTKHGQRCSLHEGDGPKRSSEPAPRQLSPRVHVCPFAAAGTVTRRETPRALSPRVHVCPFAAAGRIGGSRCNVISLRSVRMPNFLICWLTVLSYQRDRGGCSRGLRSALVHWPLFWPFRECAKLGGSPGRAEPAFLARAPSPNAQRAGIC